MSWNNILIKSKRFFSTLFSLLALFVLIIYVNQSYGQQLGLDLPARQISGFQFNCLAEQEIFDTILLPIYSANGEIDHTGLQNVVYANQYEFTADGIISPCRNVNNTCFNGLITGAEQAREVIKYMNSSYPINFLLLQIQGYKKWPTDQTANQQFIMDFTNTIWDAFNNGIYVSGIGILTSYNDWINIVGPNFTGASGMDLFWVNWNGKQDLTTGWIPFGGWTAPCFHQYAGNIVTNNCIPDIPTNYYYIRNPFCVCKEEDCYNAFRKRRMMTFANRTQKFVRQQ